MCGFIWCTPKFDIIGHHQDRIGFWKYFDICSLNLLSWIISRFYNLSLFNRINNRLLSLALSNAESSSSLTYSSGRLIIRIVCIVCIVCIGWLFLCGLGFFGFLYWRLCYYNFLIIIRTLNNLSISILPFDRRLNLLVLLILLVSNWLFNGSSNDLTFAVHFILGEDWI